MRAAIFHEHGGPEVVRIEDVARPEPGEGEALIEVRAAALNHLDLWVRRGLPIETTMPHIGGSDVAGVVAALGAGAEAAGHAVGQRVVVNPSISCGRCEWCRAGEQPLCETYRILGEHTQGGFAEFAVAPARDLYPIPDDYPFEKAAAAPLAFLTAWRALTTRARLKSGESVLVTGASGGVATAAIQIAKHAGARVFAVTSTGHVERVRGLGADVVYDRLAVDYGRELWKDTGKRGVDVVLDSVGAATWTTNVRSLSRAGRLVVYGATTGPAVETDLRLVFWKQLEILGSTMSNDVEFREVMDLVFGGALEPVVDVVWPLERAADAHARLEEGAALGKVVLVP
ncbi:MAG TPA: alcohol dehydrogenase catalytic domain-containing protein [Longimicrobiales bacterium]|nr:alcohol dehydrogenase catalytic domain-containing protein [Longimicrobiales bacterium]